MRIRPASPADAEAIHRVSVASCRAAYEDVLDDHAFLEMVDDPDRVDGLRERLAETTSTESIVYLVAEKGDEVRGFVQLLFGGDRPDHVDAGEAYLKSLYVHPDAWNEGVGSELLAEALSRLPASVPRVRLSVLAENDLGKRFYEARGFRRVDTGSFDVGETAYETDVYVRDLS